MHDIAVHTCRGSTALYCGVAIVITGMVLYSELDQLAPLSTAFRLYGMQWAEVIVAIGALLVRRALAVPQAILTVADHATRACGYFRSQSITTSILANVLGMPRIFLAMARDGLLFSAFKNVHPRFGTPLVGTFVTGGVGTEGHHVSYFSSC